MQGHTDSWRFSIVFLISAIGGVTSLYFIKRIPDVPSNETTFRSAHPVPWLTMLGYQPFLRLIGFNLLFMLVIGSLGVFSIEYLREFPKFGADLVLALSAISFVGPLLSLLITASIIDTIGSKPILRIASVGFILVLSGWLLIAGGVIPCVIPIVATLNFLTGLSAANFNVANTRIMMATMPEMGRNHFFALFTVITSLGLGTAPIMWGMALDAIGNYEFLTGWFVWRRHSMYFGVLLIINLFALTAISGLQEGNTARDDTVVAGRMRRFSRIWMR